VLTTRDRARSGSEGPDKICRPGGVKEHKYSAPADGEGGCRGKKMCRAKKNLTERENMLKHGENQKTGPIHEGE